MREKQQKKTTEVKIKEGKKEVRGVQENVFLVWICVSTLQSALALSLSLSLCWIQPPKQQTKQAADVGRRSSGDRRCCRLFHLLKRNITLICFTSEFFTEASFQPRGSWLPAGAGLSGRGRGFWNSWSRVRRNNITDEQASFSPSVLVFPFF